MSKRCRQNGKQWRPWSSRSSLIWVYTVAQAYLSENLGTLRQSYLKVWRIGGSNQWSLDSKTCTLTTVLHLLRINGFVLQKWDWEISGLIIFFKFWHFKIQKYKVFTNIRKSIDHTKRKGKKGVKNLFQIQMSLVIRISLSNCNLIKCNNFNKSLLKWLYMQETVRKFDLSVAILSFQQYFSYRNDPTE